jgi:hypothetical protein
VDRQGEAERHHEYCDAIESIPRKPARGPPFPNCALKKKRKSAIRCRTAASAQNAFLLWLLWLSASGQVVFANGQIVKRILTAPTAALSTALFGSKRIQHAPTAK